MINDDSMTFSCSECEFQTSIEFNSRDYFGKQEVMKGMTEKMKEHKIQTGHTKGWVYHRDKKFLETNASDGVRFV